MRRWITTIVLCLSLPLAAAAGGMRSDFLWDIRDVVLEKSAGGDKLNVSVTFNILSDAVEIGSAVVLQPCLFVDETRVDLMPVSFYRLDVRGRRAKVRSDSKTASGRESEVMKVCGYSNGPMTVTSVVDCPENPGALLRVAVEVTEWRCLDRKNVAELRDVALFIPAPMPEFVPELPVMPLDAYKYPRERVVSVPLAVTFEEGKTAFDSKNAVNECALYDFASLVTPVIGSPKTKVSDVTLRTYTDILGSSSSNQSVSSARLNGVYAVLKKQGVFKRKSVRLEALGEDWAGLERWIAGTFWGADPEVLRILSDGDMPKDVKERELKANAPLWDCMKSNLFPGMNRFECSFKFSITDYAGDDERWVAYNQDKRMLMPYDFYCLLVSFEQFSPAWYDVVFDFVDQYPDCLEARIAALSALFSQGRTNEAGEMLRDIEQSDFSDYYRAVWLILLGRVDESQFYASNVRTKALKPALERMQAVYDWKHSTNPWTKEVYLRFKES